MVVNFSSSGKLNLFEHPIFPSESCFAQTSNSCYVTLLKRSPKETNLLATLVTKLGIYWMVMQGLCNAVTLFTL